MEATGNNDQSSPGVESPVFWGSAGGVVISAVLAGIAYALKLQAPVSKHESLDAMVAFFAALVGIRYYASVVFLSYQDFMTKSISAREPSVKKFIFTSQCILIFGSSINISFLTVFGAFASAFVILIQALSTALYWIPLRKELILGNDRKWQFLMLLAEFTVASMSVVIMLRESACISGDSLGGESMLLGAFLMVFVAEVAQTYLPSLISFYQRTRDYMNTPVVSTPAAQAGMSRAGFPPMAG
jgi:hypothetical protein